MQSYHFNDTAIPYYDDSFTLKELLQTWIKEQNLKIYLKIQKDRVNRERSRN